MMHFGNGDRPNWFEVSIPLTVGWNNSEIGYSPNSQSENVSHNDLIARDIVVRNKHIYFGRTMELGVSFQILNISRMH